MCRGQLTANSEWFDIGLVDRDGSVYVAGHIGIALFALRFFSATDHIVVLAIDTDRSICVTYRWRNELFRRPDLFLLGLDLRVPGIVLPWIFAFHRLRR